MSEENTQATAEATPEATIQATPETATEGAQGAAEPAPETPAGANGGAAPQTVNDQITDAVTQAEQPSATEEVIVRVEEATAQAIANVPEELTNVALAAAVTGLEIGAEALSDALAKIEKLTAALENCRLYAARHARREEWARQIGRFCEEADVTGSPLRG